MGRSRVLTLAAATFAVALTPSAALAARGRPQLSVTPRDVHFGQRQLVSGHQWRVIEFCRRTVRVELISAQNRVNLGTARVRPNGTFTRRWTPRRADVGAGRWKVRATQRCESGKDGSAIYIRRTKAIRISAR
jgi:hypothetical protein